MTGLGERLEALVSSALGDLDVPEPGQIVGIGRQRRVRRRVLAAAASFTAAASVAVTVAVWPQASVTRVTTAQTPVTGPAGTPPLAAIASRAIEAASGLPGAPAQVGEVVGTTRRAAEALLAEPLSSDTPSPRVGPDTLAPATTTTGRAVGIVAVWWVLLTRYHPCPPGCADATVPAMDYVSVVLRAGDLQVVEARDLGSDGRNLALAGPVYPLLLPGQSLPSAQPTVAERVVPAATVEAADLQGEGCAVPPHLSGLRDSLNPDAGRTRCTSITVRLFPSWAALADSVPGVVEPGLAESQPARPVYYVTIWGQLHFSFTGAGQGPAFVDHDNGIYDAITAQGEGGGTAGEPLP